MKLEEEYLIRIQDFMKSHPTIIVGTGISISMGLPGMASLQKHLESFINSKIKNPKIIKEWELILPDINKYGLEKGLSENMISDELLEIIIDESFTCIETHDTKLLDSILNGAVSTFPLADLIKYLVDSLPPTNPILNIITPNYDHIIEYACDLNSIECVTGFKGQYIEKYCEESMRLDLFAKKQIVIKKSKRGVDFLKLPKVRLYKPHGSLNWKKINDEVYNSKFDIKDSQRLIITPGITKYHKSLTEKIMNDHREQANVVIRDCESILIIGYGFNDDHLQTVLENKLKQGAPCLILSKELTDNALQLIEKNKNIIALQEKSKDFSELYIDHKKIEVDDSIWSLNNFNKLIF